MLFESPYVRVAAEYGTATLWLGLPGDPPNALDLARLRDIDAALAAVEQTPFLDILVVRSANPAGFCAGLRAEALASLPTPADRAAFAAATAWERSTSSCWAAENRPRRRITLTALNRAVETSQARGFSGIPSRSQAWTAAANASCTASSARSKSRMSRTTDAKIRRPSLR